MNKLIVAVFDTETKAFEGLTAMKSLHDDGAISIYATAVVMKNDEGKVDVKQQTDDGPVGTFIGLFTGSFIGMFAGPAGMAIGAGIGAMSGGIYDFTKADIDLDLLNEVSEALTPGKAAVLAEADETWTTPVDSRIGELDGLVFRRNKSELVDEYFSRESDELKAEMNELKEEMTDANDKTKASIQKQMDHIKEKSKALDDAIHQLIEHNKNVMDAKVSTLQKQLKKANKLRKKKLEKNMEKLKEKHQANLATLKEDRKNLAFIVL